MANLIENQDQLNLGKEEGKTAQKRRVTLAGQKKEAIQLQERLITSQLGHQKSSFDAKLEEVQTANSVPESINGVAAVHQAALSDALRRALNPEPNLLAQIGSYENGIRQLHYLTSTQGSCVLERDNRGAIVGDPARYLSTLYLLENTRDNHFGAIAIGLLGAAARQAAVDNKLSSDAYLKRTTSLKRSGASSVVREFADALSANDVESFVSALWRTEEYRTAAKIVALLKNLDTVVAWSKKEPVAGEVNIWSTFGPIFLEELSLKGVKVKTLDALSKHIAEIGKADDLAVVASQATSIMNAFICASAKAIKGVFQNNIIDSGEHVEANEMLKSIVVSFGQLFYSQVLLPTPADESKVWLPGVAYNQIGLLFDGNEPGVSAVGKYIDKFWDLLVPAKYLKLAEFAEKGEMDKRIDDTDITKLDKLKSDLQQQYGCDVFNLVRTRSDVYREMRNSVMKSMSDGAVEAIRRSCVDAYLIYKAADKTLCDLPATVKDSFESIETLREDTIDSARALRNVTGDHELEIEMNNLRTNVTEKHILVTTLVTLASKSSPGDAKRLARAADNLITKNIISSDSEAAKKFIEAVSNGHLRMADPDESTQKLDSIFSGVFGGRALQLEGVSYIDDSYVTQLCKNVDNGALRTASYIQGLCESIRASFSPEPDSKIFKGFSRLGLYQTLIYQAIANDTVKAQIINAGYGGVLKQYQYSVNTKEKAGVVIGAYLSAMVFVLATYRRACSLEAAMRLAYLRYFVGCFKTLPEVLLAEPISPSDGVELSAGEAIDGLIQRVDACLNALTLADADREFVNMLIQNARFGGIERRVLGIAETDSSKTIGLLKVIEVLCSSKVLADVAVTERVITAMENAMSDNTVSSADKVAEISLVEFAPCYSYGFNGATMSAADNSYAPVTPDKEIIENLLKFVREHSDEYSKARGGIVLPIVPSDKVGFEGLRGRAIFKHEGIIGLTSDAGSDSIASNIMTAVDTYVGRRRVKLMFNDSFADVRMSNVVKLQGPEILSLMRFPMDVDYYRANFGELRLADVVIGDSITTLNRILACVDLHSETVVSANTAASMYVLVRQAAELSHELRATGRRTVGVYPLEVKRSATGEALSFEQSKTYRLVDFLRPADELVSLWNNNLAGASFSFFVLPEDQLSKLVRRVYLRSEKDAPGLLSIDPTTGGIKAVDKTPFFFVSFDDLDDVRTLGSQSVGVWFTDIVRELGDRVLQIENEGVNGGDLTLLTL